MASAYWERKFRNIRPEEKRPLTSKERRANWWYYHKWHIVIGAVLLAIVLDLAWSMWTARQNQPDYQIACVGEYDLPEDTAAALSEALAALGEDVNGDGQVLVSVRSYPIYQEGEDGEYKAAAQMTLMADLEACESIIFLLEDPEDFQDSYEVLCRLDGSPLSPGEEWTAYALAWTDCPVLSGLELGGFSYQVGAETVSGDSQALLSDLYLARRSPRAEQEDHADAWDRLWSALTEGAGA